MQIHKQAFLPFSKVESFLCGTEKIDWNQKARMSKLLVPLQKLAYQDRKSLIPPVYNPKIYQTYKTYIRLTMLEIKLQANYHISISIEMYFYFLKLPKLTARAIHMQTAPSMQDRR